MRAIILDRHGGPKVLRVREISEPRPGPGEVRVRIEAIGVNYAEVLSRKGLYGWAPALPYTLVMEATGTIDLLGAGVTRRATGPRCASSTPVSAISRPSSQRSLLSARSC